MNKNQSQGLYKGVTTAYLILILHILLIAAMGLLVFLFGGLVRYAFWIFLGFSAVLIGSGYYFYRRMKRQGRQLKDILNTSAFKGRTVEISFLGGLASLRVGESDHHPALDTHHIDSTRQLEDPGTIQLRKLSELVKLYEDEMITSDEFNAMKRQIINE